MYNILVNKDNKCPENLGFNIVDVHSRYASNRKAEEKTYNAFKKLQKYALQFGYDIEIESAYRSFEYQQKVFDECINDHGLDYTLKYVAKPGYSEHQTGLALDICLKDKDRFIIEHDLPEDFRNFLNDNVSKFGFIIRYPKGKEDLTGYNYEPWHIRYVKDIAGIIMDNNITLEQYIKKDTH